MPPEKPENIGKLRNSRESKKKQDDFDTLALYEAVDKVFKWLSGAENAKDKEARQNAIKVATDKLKKLMPDFKIPDSAEVMKWMGKLSELARKHAYKMDPLSDYVCEYYPDVFFNAIEIKEYRDNPCFPGALEKATRAAIDKDPGDVLEYFFKYTAKPYQKEVMEKTVRSALEKDPGAVLIFFDVYSDQPYAKEILKKAGLSLSANFDTNTALGIVEFINSLHEYKDNLRFAIVEKMSASSIYALMVQGDREIFTSSFNGLFNRLLIKMRSEGKKGDEVIKMGDGPGDLRVFLRLCASYNRFGEFLKTMDPAKGEEILRSNVMDLGTSKDQLKDGTTLADTISVIKDPQIMFTMSGMIKEAYIKAEKSGDKKTMKLYGLLASIAASKTDDPWFKQMAVKYPLENVSSLASKELFNPDHKSIQQYFFYNDEDGKNSFENFLRYYRSQPDWKMEDHGTYVQISKKEKDKTVEMYANKPENEDDGPEDIQKVFASKNIRMIVIVHRGHSYHAAKTIAHITYIAASSGWGHVEDTEKWRRYLINHQKLMLSQRKEPEPCL